jgi:2'-5' RNA ligase
VPTANALAGAVETLARRASGAGVAVRWVSPTLYHVTLKFLGWTKPEALSALRDALREAVRGVEPFSFSTARLGAFPSLERARVLWAGVTSRDDALGALAAAVDRATTELGFAADRPFTGHVTPGRLAPNSPPTAMREVLLPLMEQVFSDSKVAGISLLESTLKSGSLTYRELFHFAFSSSETARKRQSPSLQLAQPSAPSSTSSATSPAASSALPSPPSDAGLLDLETDDGWPRGHGP